MRNRVFTGAILAASWLMSAQTLASVIVVTPNGNASNPGTANVNSPFGAAGSSDVYVLQVQYAASMFTNVAVGSQMTSIGFRLAPGSTSNSTALVYDDFSIQVGTGAHALGGLSRNFAENLGADTITARSGSLTFAKNQLKADACTRASCRPRIPTNSFFMIELGSPYTYLGGDVLMTFTSKLALSTIGMVVALDAVDPYSVSTVNTVGTSGTGSTPTRGTPLNFNYAPIMRFAFDAPAAAVPEPALLGLFGLSTIGLLVARRRRGWSALLQANLTVPRGLRPAAIPRR